MGLVDVVAALQAHMAVARVAKDACRRLNELCHRTSEWQRVNSDTDGAMCVSCASKLAWLCLPSPSLEAECASGVSVQAGIAALLLRRPCDDRGSWMPPALLLLRPKYMPWLRRCWEQCKITCRASVFGPRFG